jgi:hypothetical protein
MREEEKSVQFDSEEMPGALSSPEHIRIVNEESPPETGMK